MSPKQPSKQKRAAQNRNERAARAARTANAKAAARADRLAAGGASVAKGSLLSRLRGGASTGGPSTRSRGAALRATQPPGYRAALSALLAAGAAVLVTTIALRYPVDAQGDIYTGPTITADWAMTALRAAAASPEADAAELAKSIEVWTPGLSKEVVAKALWPFSLATLLPVVGAGLGFQAVRRRSPSKVVNRALYATLFGAILTQGLLLLFLPVVLAMGVSMFQVRRAEAMAAAQSRGEASSRQEDVIEVAEVDEDEPAD